MKYVKCDVCGNLTESKNSFLEEGFKSLTESKPIKKIIPCSCCGRLIFLKNHKQFAKIS